MNQREPLIYLDMDGVCLDFTTASIKANGLQPAAILALWERNFRGIRSGHEVMGLDRDAYWQAIAAQGEAYWVKLKPYPWFEALYTALSDIAPVIFLSSPTRSPSSLSGKLTWLQTRFGHHFRQYIFTAQKHLLAHPKALLIDDDETNVSRFVQAGGQAVLFPQIWNRHHGLEDRLAYTLSQVEQWQQLMAQG